LSREYNLSVCCSRSISLCRTHLSRGTRGMQGACWRLRGIHETTGMLLPLVLGLHL